MRAHVWVVGLLVGSLVGGVGCAGSSGGAGTRTDSRGVVSGRVVLSDIPGLGDLSRVRVDLGRGEGGVTPESDGTFSVSDLEPDTYKVSVTYIGGLTPTATRSAYDKFTTRAVVRAGSSVNVGDTVLVRATGTVRGKVMTNTGGPLENAEVTLSVMRGDSRHVKSAADGVFEFNAVPVGTHVLNVTAQNLARAAASTAVCSPNVVLQEEGAVVDMQDVAFAPTDVSIVAPAAGIRDTVGPRWFLESNTTSLTANVLAPFARQGRVWRSGTEVAGALPPLTDVPMGLAYTLTAEEGETAWNFEFVDGCGYQSPRYVITLVKDVTRPSLVDVQLDQGALYTRSDTANLRVSAVDVGGGLRLRFVTCDDANEPAAMCEGRLRTTAYGDLEADKTIPLPPVEGVVRVLVQVRDDAGNESEPVVSRTIVRDTVPPVFTSVSVAGTDLKTAPAGTEVEVTTTVVPTVVRLDSEEDRGVRVLWGRADAVDDLVPWALGTPGTSVITLGDTAGAYPVVFRARDAAGNSAAEVSGTLRLFTDGSVSGTVQLSRASALGAQVVLTRPDGTNALGSVAANGQYTVSNLRAGTYAVHVDPPAALAARYRRAQLGERTVFANRNAELGTTVLELRSGTATGVVTLGDQAANANEGILVVATSTADAAESYTAITDPSGTWSLLLPVGTFVFRAQSRGYTPATLGNATVEELAAVTVPAAALSRAASDFQINGGAAYTNVRAVVLSVVVPDGVTQWRVKDGTTPFTPADPLVNIPSDRNFTLDAGDGLHTVKLQFALPGGAASSSGGGTSGSGTVAAVGPELSSTITLDQTPPAAAVVAINQGAVFSNSTQGDVTLLVPDSDVTSGVAVVWWNTLDDRASARSLPFSDGQGLARNRSVVLSGLQVGTPSMDGQKRIFVWLKDLAGNETPSSVQDDIHLDRTPPALASAVNITGALERLDGMGGRSLAVSNPNVVLVMNARDACAAADPRACVGNSVPALQMEVSNTDTFAGATVTAYSAMWPWTLIPGDGAKVVYLRFRDEAGNVSTPSTVNVNLDTRAPEVASVRMENGANFTRNTQSTVTLSAVGAVAWRLATDDAALDTAAFTAATTYPLDATLNLGAGDGLKSAVAEFKDDVGNVVRTRAFITLDTTPPDVGAGLVNGGADAVTAVGGGALLDVPCADSGSGIATRSYRITRGTAGSGAFTTTPMVPPYTVTFAAGDGSYLVETRCADNAANLSTTRSITVVLDTVAPTISLSVPGASTRSTTVPVTVTGLADVAQLAVSTSDLGNCAAATYSAPPSNGVVGFTLSDGTYTFYACAKDRYGNTTATRVASGAITVDTSAPQFTASLPAFSNSLSVTLTLASTDVTTGYTVSLVGPGSLNSAPFAASKTITLTGADGFRNFTVTVTDPVGNSSSTAVSTRLDTRAPELGTPSVNQGTNVVTDSAGNGTLAIPCADDGSGLASRSYRITKAVTGSGAYTTPMALQAAYPVQFNQGEGTYLVETYCTDLAGNPVMAPPATVGSATVVFDRTAPTFTLTAPATSRSSTVAVTVSNLADMGQLAVSTTDLSNCATAVYGAATSPLLFTLPDGTHTFYACAKDRNGNATTTRIASGAVVVDTTAPAFTASVPAYTNSTSLTLTLASADVTTGYTVSLTGPGTLNNNAFATSKTITVTGADGAKEYGVTVTDAAGNVTARTLTTVLDRAPPVVNAVTPVPTTLRGTKQASITVDVTGADRMRLWEPTSPMTCAATQGACTDATYVAYYPSTVLTVSDTLGTKNLCARFCDLAGNATTPTSFSVTLEAFVARPRPTLVSMVVDPANTPRITYPVNAVLPVELNAGAPTLSADTVVQVGPETLPCTPQQPATLCQEGSPVAGPCATTCRFTLPLSLRTQSATYPVRLETPAPVTGGLGTSVNVLFLNVESLVPVIHSVNIRGVEQVVAPAGPVAVTFAQDNRLLVCGSNFSQGAAWALGGNRLTMDVLEELTGTPGTYRVSAGGYVCPPESSQLAVLSGSTEGLFPSPLATVPLTVDVPAPGGGHAEVAFGINPVASNCLSADAFVCGTSITNTAVPLHGGLSVKRSLRFPSDTARSGGGYLRPVGTSTTRLEDASGRLMARSAASSRFLPTPVGTDVGALGMEDPEGGGDRAAWMLGRALPSSGLTQQLSAPYLLGASYTGEVTASAQLDLDEDGTPEIAAAYLNADLVTVTALYPNYAPSSVSVESPSALAAADWNMDGHQDLVVAGINGGVTIFLGNGVGGFEDRQDFQLPAGGASINAVDVADMDGDLLPDLVLARFTLSVHRGLPGGGVDTDAASATAFSTTGAPAFYMQTADLNGDGWTDVVALKGGRFGFTPNLVVSLGSAGAPLSESAVVPLPPGAGSCGNTAGMALTDLGADGVLDVVVRCVDGLRQVPGDGLGGFTVGGLLPLPPDLNPARGLAVADLDADGREEVVEGDNVSSNTGMVVWRPHVPAAPTTVITGDAPTSTGFAPGAPQVMWILSFDVGSLTYGFVPQIVVPRSNGLAVFGAATSPTKVGLHAAPRLDPVSSSAAATRVLTARLSPGAPVPDRVWVRESGVSVERGVFNPAGPTVTSYTAFPAGQQYRFTDSGQGFPQQVAPALLADTNRQPGNPDDIPELLVFGRNSSGANLVVHRFNAGTGAFGAGTVIPLTAACAGSPVDAVATNLNLDNFVDLLVVCVPDVPATQPHRLLTLLGNGGDGMGNSTFTVTTTDIPQGRATGVAAGDLDGNLYPDVVVTVPGVGLLRLANSSGTLGAPVLSQSLLGASRVKLADTNQNGTLDAVVHIEDGSGDITVSTLLGNGMGGLAAPLAATVSGGELGWAVEDINGDLVPDLLAHDGPPTFASGVHVALGTGDGRFVESATIPTPSSTLGYLGSTVAAADINGDGTRDMMWVDGAFGTNGQRTFTVAGATAPEPAPGEASPGRLVLDNDALGARVVRVPAGATLPAAGSPLLGFRSGALVLEDLSVTLTLETTNAAGVVVKLVVPSPDPATPRATLTLTDGNTMMAGCSPGLPASATARRTVRFSAANSCDRIADLRGAQPAGNWQVQVTAGSAPVLVHGAKVTLLGHFQRPNRDGLTPTTPVELWVPPAPRALRFTQDLSGALNSGGCGAGPDHYAEFVAQRSGNLRVRMAGTFDSLVGIRTGPCSGVGTFTCSDDAVGRASDLTSMVVAGQRYCLNLAGYSVSDTGVFDLNIQGP